MNNLRQRNLNFNKFRKSGFRFIALIAFCILLSKTGETQILNGIVVDGKTKDALPYVHIGIINKNIGVISDNEGRFQLDLKAISNKEKIIFSIIGYETTSILVQEVSGDFLKIELQPQVYVLNEIVVKPLDVIDVKKIGRYKTSKTTTGQSGIEKFGFGGEWGIQIKNDEKKYQIEDVNFHTKFNTVDSVLFRINIYKVSGELPGEPILDKEIFTKSYAGDKWIRTSLLSENIIVNENIIVTFELVQIWHSEKGENQLFYTHGKGYQEGMSYSRNSSFDEWKINERGPIAMYLTGRILK